MSAPAPKRDKFAAMAAMQSAAADPPAPPAQEDTTTTTATAAPPPKRDKFASLAQAAASSNSSTVVESAAATPSGETQKINLDNIPRRDKFAAVQQQKTVHIREQKKKVVQERCQQRDSVWDDLDQAEATVLQVLQLAQQTAQVLAQKITEEHVLDNDDDEDAEGEGSKTPQLLRSLAVDYQKGVSKIHRLVSRHANHVVPYEASTATNRLYLQRVEHRVALSKCALLRQLVREVKEEEEEPSIRASSGPVASPEEDRAATTTDTTKRKRE